MMSLAHCLMLGLDRSAIRYVGCLPVRAASGLLTKGWAGSWRSGLGEPSTGKNSPPTPACHAVPFAEKSGIVDCAATGSDAGTDARPTTTQPARSFEPKLDTLTSLVPGRDCRRPR